VVTDRGAGVPAGVVERGASGAGSTGLGLDIARRTAEASGGALGIDASRRGTTVTLELGAPA
jgi:signal transduction histidine kinase